MNCLGAEQGLFCYALLVAHWWQCCHVRDVRGIISTAVEFQDVTIRDIFLIEVRYQERDVQGATRG